MAARVRARARRDRRGTRRGAPRGGQRRPRDLGRRAALYTWWAARRPRGSDQTRHRDDPATHADGPTDRGAARHGRLEVHPGGPRCDARAADQLVLQQPRTGHRRDRAAAGDVGVEQVAVDRVPGDRRGPRDVPPPDRRGARRRARRGRAPSGLDEDSLLWRTPSRSSPRPPTEPRTPAEPAPLRTPRRARGGRRDRRLQGRRGLPAADRRGLRGRPCAHRGGDDVRRPAHLHRARRPACPDLALRRRARPDPAHAARAVGRRRRGRPRDGRPARAVRRGPRERPAHGHPPRDRPRPVVVCPAMHTEMWEHPSVQDNLEVLRAPRRARRRARGGAARGRRRGPGPPRRPRADRARPSLAPARRDETCRSRARPCS